MKILNSPSYREVGTSETVSDKTPISKLPPTTELAEKSLIHIAQWSDADNSWQSMKITMGDFQQKIYEAVQNTLKTTYWDTHEEGLPSHTGDEVSSSEFPDTDKGRDMFEFVKRTSFSYMLESLKNQGIAPVEIGEDEVDGFSKHIYFDFNVLKRYLVLREDQLAKDTEDLKEKLEKFDCFFSSEMVLSSSFKRDTLSNYVSTSDSADLTPNDNKNQCQMSISIGNRISNQWTVPRTGNLVIVGWLDSSAVLNTKALSQAYCVVEAKMNNTSDVTDNWEVIAVQPVIPAKIFTYVGFNLPVKKDLILRVRTGFDVGGKSGQYSNEQDGYDTLANNTPNGFKCVVYSNPTESEGTE